MDNLDPEPFSCYGAVITDSDTGEWERRELARHAFCHEGDVHFNPRPEYEQDPEAYPDSIWGEEES